MTSIKLPVTAFRAIYRKISGRLSAAHAIAAKASKACGWLSLRQ